MQGTCSVPQAQCMHSAPVLPGCLCPLLLCAGWYCASKAGIQQHVSTHGSASVALVGCGPVGLMSLLAAQALEATQVRSLALLQFMPCQSW